MNLRRENPKEEMPGKALAALLDKQRLLEVFSSPCRTQLSADHCREETHERPLPDQFKDLKTIR